MSAAIPLSVLDLVPVSSGSTPAEAIASSMDLARRAESLGYRRYWLAEHHLNRGVAGTAPAIMTALVAGATSSIRVGSAGVQMGHRTPLSVVEEFGLLDAVYPGRLDLGLGRTLGTPRRRPSTEPGLDTDASATPPPESAGGSGPPAHAEAPLTAAGAGPPAERPRRPKREAYTVDGMLIPSPPSLGKLLHSPRVGVARGLLQQPEAITPDYATQIGDLLALLRGEYRSAEGLDAHVHPGEGAKVEVWILGSSGGASADVAGVNGLRFAANYHVSPATVLEAIEGYRKAFQPSEEPTGLDRPYLSVSVDALAADDEATARRLAVGYGLWVRSIRSGEGAIPFPTPEEADAYQWTEEDRAAVLDRTSTHLVGSAEQVVEQLDLVARVTGADELAITTETHDPADRLRSYELIAKLWNER